jgi:branched-chain amino acid transport system substrate-binding protein
MNKKAWIGIAAIVVVAVIAVVLLTTRKQPDTITIGAILPLTGEAAQWGIPPQNAASLAVEEINAEGGVDGKRLTLLVEDSKAEPKEGVSAFNKIVATSDTKVVLGAVASSVTLAVAPLAERNHVVLFSPASTSPKITDAGDYCPSPGLVDTSKG